MEEKYVKLSIVADLEMRETTKTVNKKCQDCGKPLSILCSEKCKIVAVRCPDCLQTFLINTIEIEQLRKYLKRKGWEEVPIERKEVIKVCSPHPTLSVFIPARRNLIDYAVVMKHSLNTIAAYHKKKLDDVLSEVLKEGAG